MEEKHTDGPVPDSPRLARALGNRRALKYWSDKAQSFSDEEFVEWLRLSCEPYPHRPLGVPDFIELQELESVKERVATITDSRSTALQKQLRCLFFPTTRGRRQKMIEPQRQQQAKAEQSRITALVRQARKDDPAALGELGRLIRKAYPTSDRDSVRSLVVTWLSPKKKPSEVAAHIAGVLFGVAARRVKRGRAPKSVVDRPRQKRRVIAVKDLDAVIHAKEARRRGQSRAGR